MDDLLRQTRVMLVPSVWAEARSRVVLESMSRSVPVLASDVGGLHEAKLGVPYLIRVHPIVRYKPALDSNLVPIADVPPQDPRPWVEVLTRLLSDRGQWEELARASRKAALEYAAHLTAEPFESYLLELLHRPKRVHAPQTAKPVLSDDKRRLLSLRLKQRRRVEGTNRTRGSPALTRARERACACSVSLGRAAGRSPTGPGAMRWPAWHTSFRCVCQAASRGLASYRSRAWKRLWLRCSRPSGPIWTSLAPSSGTAWAPASHSN